MNRVLLAVAIATTAPTIASADPARHVTARSKLKLEAAQLPKHGIYAAGGGLTSSAWRIVVDKDAKTVRFGTTPKSNAPSTGKLGKEDTKKLEVADLDKLMKLGEAAWREDAKPNDHPTADYDEVLVVLDGDDAYFLEGFGPIREQNAKNAAATIAALRAAAGW